LRAYAPVTTAREVAKETQIRGCTFKSGHMVLLSFRAANRVRRCFLKRIGSSSTAPGTVTPPSVLASALAEWLARVPEFRLDPDEPITWSEGTVRGPHSLPMLLGP
jgi:hypothetical protein